MSILALDLGTKTGYALLHDDKLMFGTRVFKRNYPNGGNHWVDFYSFIHSLVERYDIKSIYYEGVNAHKGVIAAHCYGGFKAVLQMFCHHSAIQIDSFGVTQIKKFWAGKGNANKEMMVNEAINHGFDVDDDNQADAVALLHTALNLQEIPCVRKVKLM